MAKPSFFSETTTSRLPDDTVFFSIFPDSSLSPAALQSLHLEIIDFVSPFTSPYIWQHEPFSLSIALSSSCACTDTPTMPHLHGKLKYGDNLEDEWFAVFLLFRISAAFPSKSIRVWDTDGEFLLIEAAFHLPRWLNPETSLNRVFIRGGDLHIVPRSRLPDPSLVASLRFLIERGNESRASDSVQSALKSRISDYPERAWRSMHRVRVRVPVSVAQVLRHEPLLISLAVEGFYDRDIDSMKHAAKMEKFLSKGRDEEIVLVLVNMSRAMYGQLVQQKFQAPNCYPMPSVSDRDAYIEAELGMKIACGMEMMYQLRRKDGEDGKGISWSKYKENLEKNGYFEGLLSGSKDYKRLMENAEEYYQKSSSFSRTRDIMSAPVRRIDEILALPYSEDDIKGMEVPVSDSDSWLYDGEDELNSVLQERQKEMEFYNSKKESKKKAREKQEAGSSSEANMNNFDLGDISKSMQQFIQKVSSYEGAEVPKNRDFIEVNLDVDRFMKDIESMLGSQSRDKQAGDDSEDSEGSSMDMDFDDFEDDSEGEESNEDAKESFEESYYGAMNEELKNSTLEKSFEHVNQHSSKQREESSKTSDEKNDEFTPIDADFNLVKNLLESYSSQQGLPGPASNLLGLMGLQLPKDSNDKN
ncbi:PREDICTED: LOW QUALITY PROTEIN: protein ecdysoneless homolog [Camelina sativa]|uniref:LOW QUALITY PROTEIN: protein ecdysoneless homolog n=1 Tax=Camelina sativa TaxID=90675 RepID=A0ABM0UQE4_CAMSA|nr:PREDICTED: LOW QUALITY PROTEIN: protein ecdysoneless homolog [Camelina sativa]